MAEVFERSFPLVIARSGKRRANPGRIATVATGLDRRDAAQQFSLSDAAGGVEGLAMTLTIQSIVRS
jgi:hypothetical protein